MSDIIRLKIKLMARKQHLFGYKLDPNQLDLSGFPSAWSDQFGLHFLCLADFLIALTQSFLERPFRISSGLKRNNCQDTTSIMTVFLRPLFA